MNVKRMKEEMQFLTGIVTDDVDYLLYLLVRQEKKVEPVSKVIDVSKDSYTNDDVLDDWFNNL